MGVTIESKNYSIEMGYNGFKRLRTKIAELTTEEIAKHYKHLDDAPHFGDISHLFFDSYNKKIEELDKKYNYEYDVVLNFLYASDCNAEIPYTHCKKIYELIKDYDDDILYGYVGQPDCAKFVDFKNLVKDCIDNKCSMEWW